MQRLQVMLKNDYVSRTEKCAVCRHPLEYSVLNNNYTDRSGEAHYDIVLRIDSVKLQESKAVTTARREAGQKKSK